MGDASSTMTGRAVKVGDYILDVPEMTKAAEISENARDKLVCAVVELLENFEYPHPYDSSDAQEAADMRRCIGKAAEIVDLLLAHELIHQAVGERAGASR